jgi:ribonuclease P protein component
VHSRFGISVKKALGGSVVRNRIRRRIREILRLNFPEIPIGWDIVIHPRNSAARVEFSTLTAELVRLIQSIQ